MGDFARRVCVILRKPQVAYNFKWRLRMSPETSGTASSQRGTFLTVMAVLFVVLAISDFTKALQHANDPAVGGLVILGHKFTRTSANLVLGPLFGLFLLTYAYGLWNMK